jgi:hypothetical protein
VEVTANSGSEAERTWPLSGAIVLIWLFIEGVRAEVESSGGGEVGAPDIVWMSDRKSGASDVLEPWSASRLDFSAQEQHKRSNNRFD